MSNEKSEQPRLKGKEFFNYFNQKFSDAIDYDEEFHRLPMPSTNDSLIDQVILIDKLYGLVKNKDYDPYKSKTYKLLKSMISGEEIKFDDVVFKPDKNGTLKPSKDIKED